MDLALITKNISPDIEFLILYRSYNYYGSYFIKLSKSLHKDIFSFRRIDDDIDFSDINVLHNFIKLGLGKAEKYALFFGMHGYTWFIKPSPYKFITVDKIKEIILRNNIVFDIIGFDCCYMSTIETVYELNDCARYIIACENASPNLGFNSEEMVNAFSSGDSPDKIAIRIAKGFIKRNNIAPKLLEYPTDVAVIDLKYVEELVKKLSVIGINDDFLLNKVKNAKIVNEEGYETYDLYYVIYKSDIDNEIKTDILQLINNMIILYIQSDLLKQENISCFCYGIGFTPFPYKINENSFSYRGLKVKKQFCDKAKVIPGC